MATRILVIDDDRELCALLADYLAAEGFLSDLVHDGLQGVEQACGGQYDLVVLDVMLPGLNGFEALRRIRGVSAVPVLMLTARGEEVDRIVGLELGADDYLPKPFNPRELVARIRAIQRRSAGSGTLLRVADLELDAGARAVRQEGRVVELTSVEFSLLELLLAQAGRVITRDELCRQAMGRRFSPYDRSIDVHISSLRRKLGPAEEGSERIKSVRGVGYIYLRPSAEGGSR